MYYRERKCTFRKLLTIRCPKVGLDFWWNYKKPRQSTDERGDRIADTGNYSLPGQIVYDTFDVQRHDSLLSPFYIKNPIRSFGVIHSKWASEYAAVKDAGAHTRLPTFHLISYPVITPSSISMRSTSFFCCVLQKASSVAETVEPM